MLDSDLNDVLLHGLLHIKIIGYENLRNKDGLRGLRNVKMLKVFTKDLSDPFIKVYLGHRRVLKTRTIDNNLNPEWNEIFYINVCDYVKVIKFECRDHDFSVTSEHLGTHLIAAQSLIKFDENGKSLRVGFEREALFDNNPRHGKIKYYISYVPKVMLESMQVPGVYFKQHHGNKLKLYVNADDGTDCVPEIRYGGANDDEKLWKPQRLWKDIYNEICDARHFIYITGLCFKPDVALLRGEELKEAEANSNYSPYLGELLKQKANENVRVNILIWDDPSTLKLGNNSGVTGYDDEKSRLFFSKTKVNFQLAPMQGDTTNSGIEKFQRKILFFTHHQKSIIMDVASHGDATKREPMAFVGGVDLTGGRWDNRKHPLFRSLKSEHHGDFYSQCFYASAEVGPRQPWHDIHCCIRGPGVIDVIENFKERWSKQAMNYILELVDLHKLSLASPTPYSGEDQWHTQLLRSIDARTAHFCPIHLSNFDDESLDDQKLESSFKMCSVMDLGETKFDVIKQKTKQKMQQMAKTYGDEHFKGKMREFTSPDMETFRFLRDLDRKKGRNVDASVQAGLIHHIRHAKHHIYMESQYFMGSSHLWSEQKNVKCGNLIPAELVVKICEKIARHERFMVYILLPLWPEGDPASKPMQELLVWQRLTMEAMYKRIAKALDVYGQSGKPTDYLNFYCLGTRETVEGSHSEGNPKNKKEILLSETRRHQIYVHSKMMIVDDEVVITGSANVNQRSLDGTRDSELMLASFQPMHVATEDEIPRGDVHGFRLHCWASIIGTMEDVFRNPKDLDCVKRINQIAEENWQKYMGEDCCDMNSHLMQYPIHVSEKGVMVTRPDLKHGYFPDTMAKIKGTNSSYVPDYASC